MATLAAILMAVAYGASITMAINSVTSGVLNQQAVGKLTKIIKDLTQKAKRMGIDLTNKTDTLSWLQSAAMSTSDYGTTKRVLNDLVKKTRSEKNDLQKQYEDVQADINYLQDKKYVASTSPDVVHSIGNLKDANDLANFYDQGGK